MSKNHDATTTTTTTSTSISSSKIFILHVFKNYDSYLTHYIISNECFTCLFYTNLITQSVTCQDDVMFTL